MTNNQGDITVNKTTGLTAPTLGLVANVSLLGSDQGLPVAPLHQQENFISTDFEHFTLEWASDYLTFKVPGIVEAQQRSCAQIGGSRER